jgi:hypothetical protein
MVKLTDKSLDMGNSAKFNRRFGAVAHAACAAPVSAAAGLGVGYAPRP